MKKRRGRKGEGKGREYEEEGGREGRKGVGREYKVKERWEGDKEKGEGGLDLDICPGAPELQLGHDSIVIIITH